MIAMDRPKHLCMFLGLPKISWDILQPCPMSQTTWDYQGHPGVPQPCPKGPISTWDCQKHPGISQLRDTYKP